MLYYNKGNNEIEEIFFYIKFNYNTFYVSAA